MENYSLNGQEHDKPASLVNILNVVFKRKKLIITFFVTVVTIVTVGSYLWPPVYEASAKLILEREVDSEKILLLGQNFRDGYDRLDWISTEIDIIKSHPVAVQVVRDLKLDELDQDSKFSSNTDPARRFDKAVEGFEKTLSVSNSQNSNVIEIGYEGRDPRVLKEVVEKVISTYVNYRLELADGIESYQFFEDQMHIADENLRQLESRQTEYKKRKGMISPEDQRGILLARLADYEKTLTDVKMRRISREAKLAVIKKHQQNGGEMRIPSTGSADNMSRVQFIEKLESDLLDRELQRDLLLQKFTPQYQEVVDLEKQIMTIKTKIKQEIQQIIDMEEASLSILEAEENALRASIDNTKKEMQEFTKDEYELTQLKRGIDDNLELYSMFSKQWEEARISRVKPERGVKARVISPAYVPQDPVKPRKAYNIMLGLFFGLVGAFGFAFFIDYFDHSVGSPFELEQLTELNALGSVRVIEPDGAGEEEKLKSKVG